MRGPATLLTLLDQAFQGASWHGTPLGRSLAGVTPAAARWRPRRNRHNIWELVLHTAYWKHTVRQRLTGAAGPFLYPGANWPRLPDPADARAWRRALSVLKAEHRRLREVVARIPPGRLGRRVGRSRWTHLETILGIAAHDLYHAGQIQLLKRLRAGPR